MACTAPGRKGSRAGPTFLGRTQPVEAEGLDRRMFWGETRPFATNPVLPTGLPFLFSTWHCQQQESHQRHRGFASVPFGNWHRVPSPEVHGWGRCLLQTPWRIPWQSALAESQSPLEADRSIQWPPSLPSRMWQGPVPLLSHAQANEAQHEQQKEKPGGSWPLPPVSALDRAVLRFGLLMSEELRWERLWKWETGVWDECCWIASYGACSHLQSFVIAKNGALQIPWRDWRQTDAAPHQEVCLDRQPRSEGSVHYLLLSSSSPSLTSFPWWFDSSGNAWRAVLGFMLLLLTLLPHGSFPWNFVPQERVTHCPKPPEHCWFLLQAALESHVMGKQKTGCAVKHLQRLPGSHRHRLQGGKAGQHKISSNKQKLVYLCQNRMMNPELFLHAACAGTWCQHLRATTGNRR